MSLPDKPGQLGDISSLIGSHKLNISSLEMVGTVSYTHLRAHET